jgi:DNA-binding response OmpR family regulator
MEKKGRLLVVDDDRAIRKLLERIARRAGFEVDSAKDGIEALEKLDQQDYDVALIDLMMPRLSGYELVQRIGMRERERRPILIVATALTNGDVASVDDTLVRHVIRKPFDVHAVVAALTEALHDLKAKGTLTVAHPAAAAETEGKEKEKEGEGESPNPLNVRPPS